MEKKNPAAGGRGRAQNIQHLGRADILDLTGNAHENLAARKLSARFKMPASTARLLAELAGLGPRPGRQAWTLERLIDAGPRGLTTIDHPAPRTSAYVFFLKRDYGINIDMVRESHKGAFPGVHGRYFLRSEMELVADNREAA